MTKIHFKECQFFAIKISWNSLFWWQKWHNAEICILIRSLIPNINSSENFTMFLHLWKNWDKISQYRLCELGRKLKSFCVCSESYWNICLSRPVLVWVDIYYVFFTYSLARVHMYYIYSDMKRYDDLQWDKPTKGKKKRIMSKQLGSDRKITFPSSSVYTCALCK